MATDQILRDNEQSNRVVGCNKPMSMHEGIAPWCDCCVCEAEPYWAEVAEEMGISLSDYEDNSK